MGAAPRPVPPAPAADEAQRELLLLAARHHGIGTQQDLGHYYMVKRAGPLLRELVEAGELREVSVEGWTQPAYLHPQAKLPRRATEGGPREHKSGTRPSGSSQRRPSDSCRRGITAPQRPRSGS